MPTVTTTRTPRRRSGTRLVVGLVVVAVGVLLLLNTTGIYETSVWTYVPSLLVLWGLYSLARNRLAHLFWSLTLVVAGVAWQLVALGTTTWGEVVTYWPVLLVLAGIAIVTGHFTRGRRADLPPGIAIGRDEDFRATDLARGGDVVAVFGRSTLDFTDEAVDHPTSIDAVAILGTAEIRVPEDWDVKLAGVGVVGSFEDRRRVRPARKATPDLVVDGAAILGSVALVD